MDFQPDNNNETFASETPFVIPGGGVDVTPEDSVVPVYEVEADPEEEATWQAEMAGIQAAADEDAARKRRGINKLMALGLTEEEAQAIAGG